MSRSTAAACLIGLLAALALSACQRTETQTAPAPAPAPSAASATAPAASTPAAVEPADESQEALMQQERQAQLARAAADPVVGVIERAELCLHFGGEEPFDDARRAQINRAFTDNRCDTVVADGDALKASRPQDAARIDAALRDLR